MADATLSASDLQALRTELRLAEKLTEEELTGQLRQAVDRYMGTYMPMMAVNWSLVLNEIYPVIQYNLPAIFFRNPRVFLKPRNPTFIAKRRDPVTGEKREVELDSQQSAKTQEAILNYVLDEIRYKQEVRKVLLDALLFKHGVLWHGYKGNFGMTEEASLYIESEQVFVQRLPPNQFLFDVTTAIDRLEEARWCARWFWMRLTDLIEDDTLAVDKTLVKGQLGYGTEIRDGSQNAPPVRGQDTKLISTRYKPLIDFADAGFRDSRHAKFVKIYEVFQRPTPKERRDGQRGKIIVLTFDQPKPLRISTWDYKAKGFPGKVLQFNPVPDQKFGMADLDVYGAIADHKNLVVNQQIKNAEQLNKTWVTIAADKIKGEEDLTKIRSGENTVIIYEGESVAGKMDVKSASGGSSNELYMLDGRIDRNLQDKSGVTDLKRGFLQSGEESAASVKIRTVGGQARPAYRQDLMADFLKESVDYLNQLIKQYFPVEKAVRLVGSLDVEWSDKPTQEEIQAETDVELDVLSMTPPNPEEEIQQLQLVLQLMVEALTQPAIAQKIQEEGKTFNLSPILEQLILRLKLRNPDIFRRIRPEESQGYASIAELRAAKDNVSASIANQPPPSPPSPGQDHRARIEIYSEILSLLQAMGVEAPALQQLTQAQGLVQQQESSRLPQAGRAVPKVPTVRPRPQLAGAL